MKSDQEFIQGVYEKAKQYEHESYSSEKRLHNGRKINRCVAAAVLVLITTVSLSMQWFSDISPAEDSKQSQSDEISSARMQPDAGGRSIPSISFDFEGNVISVEYADDMTKIKVSVTKDLNTDDSIGTGDVIELHDSNKVADSSWIGENINVLIEEDENGYVMRSYELQPIN